MKKVSASQNRLWKKALEMTALATGESIDFDDNCYLVATYSYDAVNPPL